MISWGGRFSAVLHAYGIFMFNFFKELIFNCVGHPCQKKTITNSIKLQIVLLMLLMAVIISSSCCYTTGKSELESQSGFQDFWKSVKFSSIMICFFPNS